MTIILLLISFFIVFSVNRIYHTTYGLIESLLTSVIYFSLLLLFSTEVLSLLHLLNYTGVTTFWLFISLFGSALIYKNKISLTKNLSDSLTLLSIAFKQLSFFYKTILISSILLLILILVQGMIYPPNNWDSMTYHLPRISHWIQNESVENYPTHIVRQLYQPLFSEYVILHTHILFGGDLFSNAVQFFFLVLTTFAVIGILKEFNVNKSILFITTILCFTLPEALLEASSTQNDLTHSFFILTAIYYAIKSYKITTPNYFLLFGISVGFCLVTKVIAYLYAPFIVLVFAIFILYKIIKEKQPKFLLYSFIVIIPIIAINIGHSFRNYSFSGNIIGTNDKITKGIVFEKTSPKIILSSCLKNMALHSDPYFIGNMGDKIVEKAHLLIHFNINEPGTNVFDMKFKSNSNWKNHEDVQPNFLHLILFLTCVLFYFIHSIKSKSLNWIAFTFLITISLQFILFSAYLCWEPWNTRLHLPLFFEMVVFIAIIFSQINMKRIDYLMYLLLPLLMYYASYVTLHNRIRPYLYKKDLTAETHLFSSRFYKYFGNFPEKYNEFKDFQDYMVKNKLKNIGLISSIDGWEYPIIMNRFQHSDIKINHILLTNSTKNLEKIRLKIDYIVSIDKSENTLTYNKQNYYLVTPKNKYLFIYTKK